MKKIIENDLLELIKRNDCGNFLNNKRILITGANGLIANYLTLYLLMYNKIKNTNIKVVALIRNSDFIKNGDIFKNDKNLEILKQDVCEELNYSENIDYIFHAAGNASAYKIRNNPVDIIKSNLIGTINILEFAKKHNTKKVIFPSTREIYGKIDNLDKITEKDMGILDPLEARNCYPESKRMAESIIKSYSEQYNLNFNILRIAHTYGPSMILKNDGRVMADLINNVVNNEDIILNSDGTAIRAFCYVTDAIDGILRVIKDGINNEAYNLSNTKEPITIRDLSNKIINISKKNLQVKFKKASDEIIKGYTNYKIVEMDNSKLQSLNWKPVINLDEGILRTLNYFEEDRG